MTRILIVKLSSLGDIVQAFPVLPTLHRFFPGAKIDWAVSHSLQELVAAHPLVHSAIPLSPSLSSLSLLRATSYDLLFDLQGNSKSGFVTLLARAKEKIGYGFSSVREWPNLLATRRRFSVSRNQNIRSFYLDLICKATGATPVSQESLTLRLSTAEKERVNTLLDSLPKGKKKILICPGSHWKNKRFPSELLSQLLLRIKNSFDPFFLFAWGSSVEREECQLLAQMHGERALLLEKFSLPALQLLMSSVDLLIGVDSIALHLSATTSTPTLSLFGPTQASLFCPTGAHHRPLQGKCPYGVTFFKQCPRLRSCPTGACMQNFTIESVYQQFASLVSFDN
ncbi:MAG: glycosyltransferase family 9 protein [Verrucomicrobiota bacterium]|nr:glycosyltransferase family 9 protein [Verrucomicrobiota bacterium]